MRNGVLTLFVEHEGQIELEAHRGGNIYSADYDDLVTQLVSQINAKTKGNVRLWAESSFTTTTQLHSMVSKLALMGAMHKYFTYVMRLECGLPRVTLDGVEDDWKSVLLRVAAIGKLGDATLTKWSEVLTFVLQNFVAAFNDSVDKDFWNRIAHVTGGGSGPRYLEGWVCALIGLDKDGRYVLNNLDVIKATNRFARIVGTFFFRLISFIFFSFVSFSVISSLKVYTLGQVIY